MGEQSNLSIGHSPGNEPGKTKTVNAESSNGVVREHEQRQREHEQQD